MPNTLLTISMITRESLRVLENSLTFTLRLSRTYDDHFAIAGAKIGNVINVRKPPRYLGRVGQTLSIEDSTETSVPVALTTQRGVDINFTSADLTLSVDDFSKRFLYPAIASVANAIDYDNCQLSWQVYNMIGTVGTPPPLALTYLQAGQRLNEEACPVDDRSVVIPPSYVPPIVDSLKGLFQSAERIAEQYERGQMGIGLGFKWYMDQNLGVARTAGAGGTATVSGAGQTGGLLAVAGFPASTLVMKKGDVFTLPNVYAVNPQNHMSTGQLRQFTVTADVTTQASGPTLLPISPPIIPQGGTGSLITQFGPSPVTLGSGFATVSAAPANGATLALAFTANQVTTGTGVAFFEEAFTMACADLLLPGGVDMASRVADAQLGLSIRLVRAYDINQDRFPTRLDILYGNAVLYAEMACRIAG